MSSISKIRTEILATNMSFATLKKQKISPEFNSSESILETKKISIPAAMATELWLYIFSMVSLKEVCSLGRVSKQFREITNDKKIWKNFFKSHYFNPAINVNKIQDNEWKEVCHREYLFRKNLIHFSGSSKDLHWSRNTQQMSSPEYVLQSIVLLDSHIVCKNSKNLVIFNLANGHESFLDISKKYHDLILEIFKVFNGKLAVNCTDRLEIWDIPTAQCLTAIPIANQTSFFVPQLSPDKLISLNNANELNVFIENNSESIETYTIPPNFLEITVLDCNERSIFLSAMFLFSNNHTAKIYFFINRGKIDAPSYDKSIKILTVNGFVPLKKIDSEDETHLQSFYQSIKGCRLGQEQLFIYFMKNGISLETFDVNLNKFSKKYQFPDCLFDQGNGSMSCFLFDESRLYIKMQKKFASVLLNKESESSELRIIETSSLIEENEFIKITKNILITKAISVIGQNHTDHLILREPETGTILSSIVLGQYDPFFYHSSLFLNETYIVRSVNAWKPDMENSLNVFKVI